MNPYKRICSCCGSYIYKEDFENGVIPDDNKEPEGNHCGQCYGELLLQNWFEHQETFDMVSKALSPINRLKFDYAEPYMKYHYCEKMRAKGIITYKIG